VIKNVQNVYIDDGATNTPSTPFQFPLTVTVLGMRVNVNAATTMTNHDRAGFRDWSFPATTPALKAKPLQSQPATDPPTRRPPIWPRWRFRNSPTPPGGRCCLSLCWPSPGATTGW